MVAAEEVLAAQGMANSAGMFFCSFVLFLHGAGVGAGLGYAGLVLPSHTG